MDLRPRRLATAAALLVLALLAASCGRFRGSDDDAAPAPSGPPSTTAPSTSAPTTSTTSTPATTSTAALPPTTALAVDPDHPSVRSAAPVTGKAIEGTVQTADGRTRTFHVYLPKAVRDGGDAPVPLLVALHGGTGWGQQFERNSGFDGLAEANGFVVVYPDGVGVGADGADLRTWNGGACCGSAARGDVDDVAFVAALIDELESSYPIDPTRVFAAGHSNGGILAYRLACELSDRIVAIGVQSSALEVPTCHPDHPVSVLHVHGAADRNLPIGGGEGPDAMSGVAFAVPLDGAATLAAADGCPAEPSTSTDPANRDLTIRQWVPCEDGTAVAFVEVAGASHAWMGHATGGSGKVGPVYEGFDSSLQIWDFLSRHPRTP